MSKRKRRTTPSTYKRHRKEGRGDGKGPDYKPGLTIQDVPSSAFVYRIFGWTTHRVHHLLSFIEATYFRYLDLMSWCCDIREQFPLDLEETLLIAKVLGIEHPKDRVTGYPIQMTTDFLRTDMVGGREVQKARTVKLTKELKNKRTRAKFLIERIYYSRRGIDWAIVTENEIPLTIMRNCARIHPHFDLSDTDIAEQDIEQVRLYLLPLMKAQNRPLRRLTQQSDTEFGYEPGTSFSIVYHLLATQRWQIDWYKPMHPYQPLVLLNSELETEWNAMISA